MPSFEREAPDRHLRHQHSASSSALVPMWDSSDPDRAPPPLPLNPQSPSVGTSRVGTSLAIQSAHAALQEKARENALVPALQKRPTDLSPERALIPRPSPHKRMQSLQSGTVRDMSFMIEGGGRESASSTPRGSPEKPRPATPVRGRDNEREIRSTEKEPPMTVTPINMSSSLTQLMRPSAKRAQQSILGENTPPQSATMLALQNMAPASSRESESPLATVTNSAHSSAAAQPKSAALNEQLSNQLLTLTNIAASLQKEMAQLTRRSRDNATDLMSLKEATHARDEDIRKTLRELAMNVDPSRNHRDSFNGGLYLDNKAFNASAAPKTPRAYALPRIPSPNSFAASLDRESSLSTPSLIGGSDSPASMALLEKIIRDMGTKDGQDLVIDHLNELAEKLSGMASAAKIEELLDHLKAMRQAQTQPSPPTPGPGSNTHRSLSFDSAGDVAVEGMHWNPSASAVSTRVERLLLDKDGRRASAPSRPNEVLSDEMMKMIRSVKDSVAQGGGLTAEVKALVRELRGEVLGMGRDLGRKLEEHGGKGGHHSKSETASRAELARIVEEGLEQMKVYMQHRLREHRRESTESTKSAIDYGEIYNAVRTAVSDTQANKRQEPQLSREDVLEAVRDAWENYKPEIEIQQLGLERDEVLACIKEGLQEHAPQPEFPDAATKDEVFQAVVEGMKQFVPPKIETPTSLSRDEVLEAVRECLEEFEFPIAPSAVTQELTRDDMLDAVKQGLESFEFPNPNAGALVPHDGGNDEIMARLHELMQCMRDEFKAASEGAKQIVATSERETEQVLDATKDGFESLRVHIEEYFDRAAASVNSDAASQEELMANLVNSFDSFRDELAEMIAKSSDGSRDLVKQEIESLRDAVNSSLVPHVPPPADNREALEAIREGLERVRGDLLRPHAGTTDILDALHEGFSEMRLCIEKLNDKPVDFTANDEILDALKSGLDDVRGDIDTLRESNNERAIVSLNPEPMDALVPTDLVKHDDIKNLEVMMTQLSVKMDSIEIPQPLVAPAPEGVLSKDDLAEMEEMLRKGASKEDLTQMEEMLRQMQDSMAGMANTSTKDTASAPAANPEDAATKEDVQAIETILRNTKSRLDDLIDGEQMVRKEHVDVLEALALETKESLGAFTTQLDAVTRKDDLMSLESLVTQITVSLNEMKDRAEKSLEDPEKVTKTELDAIGICVLDIKSLVEKMSSDEIAALPSKEDFKNVEEMVRSIQDYNTAQAEANATALADRQTEVSTVNERVAEVKAFLEDFQSMARDKLDAGGNGLEVLGRQLEGLGQTINQNATVGSDLRDMLESMKSEFEETRAGVVGAKLDTDEKLKEAADLVHEKLDQKIGELVTKYEDFQLLIDDRARAGEARDVAMEAAVLGNKAVTEELKGLVDTLGSTVAASFEKMEEASRTVFDKVEVLYSKTEDNHAEGKTEHEMTREQVKQAIGAVEGLQERVHDYQPKILEAVKDVLLLVGEHFEHSKGSVTEIQHFIEEAKPEPLVLPPPVEKYDDAEVQAKLDKLDSGVHTKLDRLVDHTHIAGKAYAQLETLDKVYQQVVRTSADISDFLASQKQRIENEHEDREKALQDTTIALERQRAEQEHVEVNLALLREEEAQLRKSVLELRSEQEALTRQKTRLTADVSSLETALHLRREELHIMDVRAQGLERRILDGVLDHSRALLMASSVPKGREAMSRKRVARSSLGGAETPKQAVKLTAKPRAGVNMAVNSNRGGLVPPNNGGASRRILSLSQITNNVPTGGLKRSQSVRTAAGTGLRKSSWAPGRVASGKGYGELDKENVDSMRESDEEDANLEEAVDTSLPVTSSPAIDDIEDADADDRDVATPTPVDVPTPVGEEDDETVTMSTERPENDGDISDHSDADDTHDGEESQDSASDDDGTRRRSSLGSTVIAGAETESAFGGDEEEEEGAYHSDDEEHEDDYNQDGMSVDGSTGADDADADEGGEGESVVSEGIAADRDSIAGESESEAGVPA